MTPEQEALFCQGSPWVATIARRWCNRFKPKINIELADFMQWGFVGLTRAAAVFDPTRGTLFKTLAWRYIQGAMIDGVRSGGYGYSSETRNKTGAQLLQGGLACEAFSVARSPENISREVQMRIWYERLNRRSQIIVGMISAGNTQAEAAKRLGISEGRVSQLVRKIPKP